MAEFDLAAHMGASQLSPASLAELIGVDAGDIQGWLAGTSPVPVAAAAYLRVLVLLDPDTRRAETQQLRRRPGRLEDGCYSIEYKGLASNGVCLMMLTGGQLRGRDTAGGLYRGTCEPIGGGARHRLDVLLTIPPGVILVTGARAGPQGGEVRIATEIDRPAPVARTLIDVGGKPVEIALSYLGPMLPGGADTKGAAP